MRTVKLPVVGQQTVELSIISRTLARLQLRGRLNIDQTVEYTMDQSGQLSFHLTEATQRLLRRFRTRLAEAGYDAKTDTSWVVVFPPLPFSVNIRLNRRLSDDQ